MERLRPPHSAFWNDRINLSLVQEIAAQRSQNQEEEP